MRLSSKTIQLLVLTAFLAALALLGRFNSPQESTLPELPALDESQVTRITILRNAQNIVIDRKDDNWEIVQPLQARADASSIRSLLKTFKQPVPMEMKIDEGKELQDGKSNLETYEVDSQKGITFEVFTGGAEPALSMVVGKDLTGGSSAIRLARSKDVFRANVGGHFRFDKDPDGWRNKTLFDADPDNVVGLSLSRPEGALAFVRASSGLTDEQGRPSFEKWFLSADPSFPLDQKTLGSLARSFCTLRASQIHAAGYGSGWEKPHGTVELAFLDGSSHHLEAIPADDGRSALVRVDSQPDVFRVAASTLARIEQPLAELRDRTIFEFPVTNVDSFAIEEGSHTVRIKQDLGSNLWKIVEPLSAEADLKQVLVSIRTLAALRAQGLVSGVSAAQVGLDKPAMRFVVTMVDGSKKVLEVGARIKDSNNQDIIHVRRAGDPTIYVLRADTVGSIRKAFLKS